jgi:hypothetical protein
MLKMPQFRNNGYHNAQNIPNFEITAHMPPIQDTILANLSSRFVIVAARRPLKPCPSYFTFNALTKYSGPTDPDDDASFQHFSSLSNSMSPDTPSRNSGCHKTAYRLMCHTPCLNVRSGGSGIAAGEVAAFERQTIIGFRAGLKFPPFAVSVLEIFRDLYHWHNRRLR